MSASRARASAVWRPVVFWLVAFAFGAGGQSAPAQRGTGSAPPGEQKPELRTWTDANGQQLEARFMTLADGRVALKKTNGRILRVPLGLLSEPDQQYVRQQMQRQWLLRAEAIRLSRWKVKPGVVGRPSVPLVHHAIVLPDWSQPPKQVSRLVLDRAHARAVVGYLGVPEKKGLHPPSAGIYWCDLPTGRVLGPIAAPEVIVPAAIGKDGLLLLAREASSEEIKGESVSIWRMHRDHLERLYRWKPYAFEGDLKNRPVGWAAFADEDHVLTLNRRGNLAIWQLSTRKLVHGLLIDTSTTPRLSPDGKYLVVRANHRLQVLRSKKGEVVAEVPATSGYGLATAFSADGKQLVTAVSGSAVKIWDFASGKLLREGDIRSLAVLSVDVVDQRYLLFNDRDLYDLETNMRVCSYGQRGTRHGIIPYGGYCWCPIEGKQDTPAAIVPVKLPHPSVIQVIEHPENSPDVLLYPGVAVRLTVELDASVKGPERLREALISQLKANGLEIDPAAPIELAASIKQVRTIKLGIVYNPWKLFPGSPPDEVRDFPIYETRIALTYQGRTVWHRQHTNSVPSGLIVTDREIDLAERPAVWLFKSLGLPKYLSRSGKDLLKAYITVDGIQ